MLVLRIRDLIADERSLISKITASTLTIAHTVSNWYADDALTVAAEDDLVELATKLQASNTEKRLMGHTLGVLQHDGYMEMKAQMYRTNDPIMLDFMLKTAEEFSASEGDDLRDKLTEELGGEWEYPAGCTPGDGKQG